MTRRPSGDHATLDHLRSSETGKPGTCRNRPVRVSSRNRSAPCGLPPGAANPTATSAPRGAATTPSRSGSALGQRSARRRPPCRCRSERRLLPSSTADPAFSSTRSPRSGAIEPSPDTRASTRPVWWSTSTCPLLDPMTAPAAPSATSHPHRTRDSLTPPGTSRRTQPPAEAWRSVHAASAFQAPYTLEPLAITCADPSGRTMTADSPPRRYAVAMAPPGTGASERLATPVQLPPATGCVVPASGSTIDGGMLGTSSLRPAVVCGRAA